MSKIKEFYSRSNAIMNALGDHMGRRKRHRITDDVKIHFGNWGWNKLFHHVLNKQDKQDLKRGVRYWVLEALLVWYRMYARILVAAGDWTKAPIFLHKRARLVEK